MVLEVILSTGVRSVTPDIASSALVIKFCRHWESAVASQRTNGSEGAMCCSNVKPAFITKSRPEHNVAEAGYVVGDVAGRAAILVDDMIDTAGTLVEAARVLREAGAARVFATATHGVFSGPAFERLVDLIFVLTSTSVHNEFASRGWTADAYQVWLTEALARLLENG